MKMYIVYPRKQFSYTTDKLDEALLGIQNGGFVTTLVTLPEQHPHAGRRVETSIIRVTPPGLQHRMDGGPFELTFAIVSGDPNTVERYHELTA